MCLDILLKRGSRGAGRGEEHDPLGSSPAQDPLPRTRGHWEPLCNSHSLRQSSLQELLGVDWALWVKFYGCLRWRKFCGIHRDLLLNYCAHDWTHQCVDALSQDRTGFSGQFSRERHSTPVTPDQGQIQRESFDLQTPRF